MKKIRKIVGAVFPVGSFTSSMYIVIVFSTDLPQKVGFEVHLILTVISDCCVIARKYLWYWKILCSLEFWYSGNIFLFKKKEIQKMSLSQKKMGGKNILFHSICVWYKYYLLYLYKCPYHFIIQLCSQNQIVPWLDGLDFQHCRCAGQPTRIHLWLRSGWILWYDHKYGLINEY